MADVTLGENCSSGCITRDHESWGQCQRAKNVTSIWIAPDNNLSTQKKWQADIDHYRSAKRQGLNPEGSSRAQVDKALATAERTA